MNTMTDAPVLEIKRMIDAKQDRVFDAWMKRPSWQAWIGPEGTDCDVTQFEPKVGGRYRVLMRLSDGREIVVTGLFKTIDRPKSFAMTWKWEHGEHDSLVTLTFRPVGDKTELTLRHDGLLTQENVDGHNKGWSSVLNKLEKYLANSH
jgi:uncharacterized protein YndB with AHSA1/START domain